MLGNTPRDGRFQATASKRAYWSFPDDECSHGGSGRLCAGLGTAFADGSPSLNEITKAVVK